MTSFIISFIGWKLYLWADAYQDVDHQKRYGAFSHKTNFWCRFVVGIVLTAATWPFFQAFVPMATFGLWLIALGWFVFELIHNKLAGRDWDHVGSGGIDLWFKTNYPLTYKKRLLIAKICFLISTTALFMLTCIEYHIF